MSQHLTSALLWFSAVGCGLLAGVYFAFSAFIMTALGRVDQAAGIAAMNAINVVIYRSLFMPFFFGTTLAAAALVVLALFRLGEPGAIATLTGGVVYVLGMFVVTMVFNVPLNDALAGVDPTTGQAADLWARFRRDWTFWNHVRTISSAAALTFFVTALAVK
ncbi:DUF1772 domain-containing protein [Chelativorans salis]|uniref:DUF1772 domain-containing protein n=1 Tax=Chelativorans salis TaxID=2978478 RepID=A0ABT2LTT0_9HYPH|nr:anthrone oxygenase family protein [Chelativorans sp. EGI FJ00035]MCT7377930.1 DUF1772 domain-containing protein [Chelativorans sp. EGI FJ00035]